MDAKQLNTLGKQEMDNTARAAPKASAASTSVDEAGTEYEFEDPARCWVDLVEATRILIEEDRKNAVYVLLNEAKNSHWTHQLLDDELELQEDAVEYGGSVQDTEPYSDPEDMGGCATCGRPSEGKLFCDRHNE